MTLQKTQRNDTNFLRFFAIALIINSHLDLYYPLSLLATGGAVGNALFFMLSSYGLYMSDRRNPRTFTQWYGRRISRIYPSVWVVLIVLYIPLNFVHGKFVIQDLLEIFSFFFYPPFWFLKAIMIFYILIFFVIKRFTPRTLATVSLLTFVLYFYIYFFWLDIHEFTVEDLPFKLISCFQFMLMGIILGGYNERITYKGFRDVFLLLFCLGVVYANKFLMLNEMTASWQFLQQVMLLPALYYFLKVARSPWIHDRLMQTPYISKIIVFMSTLTLELYIAHGTMSWFFKFYEIIFPLNILVFVGLSFVFAMFIKYAAGKIVLLFNRVAET